jgi:3-hydroxyisobutyrate dehydrogenase-like beta-hydroxyacid dehydrogenase
MGDAIRNVGVIGAGRMGQPIIGHLARKGYAVLVNDVDAGKKSIAEERGGKWSAELAGLAREAEAILVCVGYDRELRELLSPAGIPRHARRGTIVAILSTVHPGTVRELARRGREHGLHVVDATMCRGGWAADEGTLLCFVAGSPQTVARLRPVLAAFASDIVHTGDIGTAQVAKAVNNMIMWACLVADHEGLALARRYGLDVDMMRQALATTHSANGALEHWGKQTMAWADDDMEIVAAMAKEKGLALKQAQAVQAICRWLKPVRFQLEQYGPATTDREGRKGRKSELRNAKDAKVAKRIR